MVNIKNKKGGFKKFLNKIHCKRQDESRIRMIIIKEKKGSKYL